MEAWGSRKPLMLAIPWSPVLFVPTEHGQRQHPQPPQVHASSSSFIPSINKHCWWEIHQLPKKDPNSMQRAVLITTWFTPFWTQNCYGIMLIILKKPNNPSKIFSNSAKQKILKYSTLPHYLTWISQGKKILNNRNWPHIGIMASFLFLFVFCIL